MQPPAGRDGPVACKQPVAERYWHKNTHKNRRSARASPRRLQLATGCQATTSDGPPRPPGPPRLQVRAGNDGMDAHGSPPRVYRAAALRPAAPARLEDWRAAAGGRRASAMAAVLLAQLSSAWLSSAYGEAHVGTSLLCYFLCLAELSFILLCLSLLCFALLSFPLFCLVLLGFASLSFA